jgi:hypothetical protein
MRRGARLGSHAPTLLIGSKMKSYKVRIGYISWGGVFCRRFQSQPISFDSSSEYVDFLASRRQQLLYVARLTPLVFQGPAVWRRLSALLLFVMKLTTSPRL